VPTGERAAIPTARAASQDKIILLAGDKVFDEETGKRISGEEMVTDGMPTPGLMEAGHPPLPHAGGNS
jgi:hypothetical protein